ncbi:unnamed protein product [Porites evermanni]|uniref:Ion transport domain-containing protein n=1 Tax=Porites evermanni TaxID=104178 RepID=A0ABN8SLQ3_9CNID|nr:unnamed protein product [Porites evermanni]
MMAESGVELRLTEIEDFEKSLRDALKQEDFTKINKKITAKALTQCKKNCLFMSMEVSYELRRLESRNLPNVDDVANMASSVEEFTNRLIDPLKSDINLGLRGRFERCFDDVMENAIAFEQKKFFTHPVINNMKNNRWYGDIGKIWTRSYFTVARWIWIFLDVWCLFDLVLFPVVFTVLFIAHIARGRSSHPPEPRQKDLYENYRDYFTTPYFIFVRDTLSYLALLGLHFAVCLSPSSIEMTGLEWAIMVFFMGRTLLEIQHLRAIYMDTKRYNQRELKMNQRLKESFKVYTRSSWNCLDLVTLIVYSCAFFLKTAVWSSSTTTVVNNRPLIVSGYLYGLNTMILTFRVFGQVMETVKGLGTIQIALFSIISDVATIFWQFAAAILAFSFAITKVYMTEISFIPTRFNGTDPVSKTSGQSCWWLIAKHLCWSLLGMAEVDSLNSVDEATVTLCKVLYAIYLVVAGVLLMNMMIALLSNTYQRVEENSLKEWSFKKAITDQTYMYLHPVPVPLNIISCIVMGVVCLCKKRIGRCPCAPECRGFLTPADDQPRDRLDVIVEDLQNTYFTTYGDAFPGTEERKLEKPLDEAEGNGEITEQIANQALASKTSRAGNGDVPVQQDLDSEDVVLSETISKTISAADASGSDQEAIHSELDDAFASFRRLRNNFLVNFRNFEDLFHDRQRELEKLASKSSKGESEVILRNLDKQELACSNIVKKMKQDLDKLGEISNEKSKVHGLLEKQVKGEEVL